MSKGKVLLTTSYGPNNLGFGEDMFDVLRARLAKGHGPFGFDSHCHYLALYMLAENISNPSTVLENPHWEDFIDELEKGYDYVCIQLKSLHTKKIARQVKYIRENYPDTEIIIGGYGVSALHTPIPGDTEGDAEYIRENAHHLCREEGVGFLRRILGDEPYDREITQYQLPFTGASLVGMGKAQAKIPNILVALGCPNACDFCNTTAFFHNKKIYVMTPEQIFRHIKHYQKRLKMKDIMLGFFDEDFFLNPDYVRELGRMLRADRNTWGVRWFGFGSTRSLSQYTAEELRECGVGQIWIGVESFIQGDGTTTDTYEKRKGEDVEKLFRDLHSHGIQTIGSLILGFDFHDKDNLKDDIDRFVNLKTTMYQISPLTPCPGTPLFDRMMEEERLLDSYNWKDVHLWKDDVFKLKNFKFGEIKKFYDYAHEKIRDQNGPPPLQIMEGVLDAYGKYKDSKNEWGKYQASRSRFMAIGTYTFAKSVKELHPGEAVRARAAMLMKRFETEVGKVPLLVNPASKLLNRQIRKAEKFLENEVVSDPAPRWSYYHKKGPYDDQVWVKRGRKALAAVPYKDRRMLVPIR